jgi:hypothetical protein
VTETREAGTQHARGDDSGQRYPYRTAFIAAESVVALGAVAGSVQLLTGTFTPPVADLEPLGLSSWVLPGVWLFSSVAIPSTAAAWLAWRRSPRTPLAVLAASGLLAVELVVQIPFVGPSALQATMGTVAVGLAAAVFRARQLGWPAGGASPANEPG